VPTLQAQNPEFKPQYSSTHQKKKEGEEKKNHSRSEG
jgi:hypothetical protein